MNQEGERIDGGKSKVDMGIQSDRDLFRPEGLTGTILCPSLKVTNDTRDTVVLIAARASDLL